MINISEEYAINGMSNAIQLTHFTIFNKVDMVRNYAAKVENIDVVLHCNL